MFQLVLKYKKKYLSVTLNVSNYVTLKEFKKCDKSLYL